MGEAGLVEDGDAELLGLGELGRAGALADDDGGRLLGHAAGRLAAVRLDGLLGRLPRPALEGAGDDHRRAGQRLRHVGCRRALDVHARGPQLVDHLAVARVGEELVHAAGDGGADALDRGQLLLRRPHDAVEVADGPGQHLRAGAAQVADVEPDEQVGQRSLLRGLDGRLQVAHRDLAEALELADAVEVERVDVAHVGEQVLVEEHAEGALAEALDVHGAPRAKWAMRAHRCWGQSTLVQNVSLSPSRRTSGPTARAALLGNFHAFSPFGRSDSTGPTTSGMTSPALRTITVSPGRTSLARTWSSLCSVARPTVEPPTNTGSSMANGVAFPVRPIDTMMSFSSVVRSSGGNL